MTYAQKMIWRVNVIFSLLYTLRNHSLIPIISLTEAKDEDMEYGVGQCAAQMYGARLYNEAEGKNIAFIYGCATDGVEWQFLKLENNSYFIDRKIYTDIREILGVWHIIMKSYL